MRNHRNDPEWLQRVTRYHEHLRAAPKKQNAEFVFRMEDVLSVYQRPLDEKRPLVCLDEASKPLLSDVRTALTMVEKTDQK